MTIAEMLRRRWGIPLLDVDILIAHCLRRDRTYVYSHPNAPLTAAQYKRLRRFIQRRRNGEPLAYIIGTKEFFDLDFVVNRHVLIPRPDTEHLVEKALSYLRNRQWSHPPCVVDIGTGCGNIAITIAKHFPAADVTMTDISKTALVVARRNAKRHHVIVESYVGDLLTALPKRYRGHIDLLVCNAPYLSKNEARKKTLAYEPQSALTPQTGAPTSIIEKLLKQAPFYMSKKSAILLEIGWRQAQRVSLFASRFFPNTTIKVYKDLGGFDRVLSIRRLYNNAL